PPPGGAGARPPLEASAPALRSLRLGAVDGQLAKETSADVAARVREAVRVLQPLVAEVEEVILPMLEEMVAAWWTICLAEASAYFNRLGLPAVSVPCGFTASGRPVGLQIVGRRGEDRLVLAAAHLYEQSAGWWTRRPPLDERTPS